MKVKILFTFSDEIGGIKISPDLWRKLHFNTEDYYYIHKEFNSFLNKNNLNHTIFNLNCLRELKGVILTELQIKELKGGNN